MDGSRFSAQIRNPRSLEIEQEFDARERLRRFPLHLRKGGVEFFRRLDIAPSSRSSLRPGSPQLVSRTEGVCELARIRQTPPGANRRGMASMSNSSFLGAVSRASLDRTGDVAARMRRLLQRDRCPSGIGGSAMTMGVCVCCLLRPRPPPSGRQRETSAL